MDLLPIAIAIFVIAAVLIAALGRGGRTTAAQPGPGRVVGTITYSGAGGPDEQLAVVEVGAARINAAIYRDYQRDTQDWSSGIRLEDPVTGHRLRDDDGYPEAFLAAGARSVAVVGIPHHADAQRPEFGVGQAVRLVAEPNNPVDPRAIAVRSVDGRLLAGYVPADDLDRIIATRPAPVGGLVVWENYTWRPRRRMGIRILIGPSVRLGLIPSGATEREAARRSQVYASGRELEEQRYASEKLERNRAREAERAARAAAVEQTRTERQLAREAAATLVANRRAAGVCVECGGPIEDHVGRGRPSVRCHACRASADLPRED